MGTDIFVNQLRGSEQLNARPIPMRLDQMNWKVASDLGGASPYDSYWLRTQEGVGTLDIRRQDLLLDIASGNQYRVFGRPMTYDQSFIRIPVEQVIGT